MLGLFKHPRLLATRPCITATPRASRAISSAFQSRPNTLHRSSKLPCTHRNAHAALAMSPQLNGTTNGHISESYGNFDLVRRLKLDFADIVVSKWQSRVTGLSVVHLDYDAPIVNGYFVIRSEIFNDSGCPHTLEHLVFMGSKQYPYKGIIDHLANRGFSNGTNAWTDTDHTAYTVSTAGEQGFLQLLPVYIDHILHPSLSQAGFVTEVHHINGKGEDSGVVYSEMQGRENTSGDLMALRMQRLLNPPGSAYRSETGGLMEALRVLNVEQIRDYHSTYYVPHNLSLIVTGRFAAGTVSLLDVIQEKIEPSLIGHGQDKGPRPEGWKRPFVETQSALRRPIQGIVEETVEFPEHDESMGELYLGFMGPPPSAYLERKALDIISMYLTSSSVAPLNKEYIEIESPLCSYIYFGEDSRVTLVDLPVYFGSVPTEHLDTLDKKFKTSLQRIADEGIDMKRMAMVINRDERQLRSKVEASKGDTFHSTVITDFLYGNEDGSQLGPAMDEINQYAELRAWTSKQWSDLLRRYYIDAPCAIVRGKPSAAMADRLEKEEKARIEAQKKKLGPEGLAQAQKALDEAKKEHEKPIPTNILTDFPVPDVKSISWLPVQSVQEMGKARGRAPAPSTGSNVDLHKHITSDGNALPFFVQYDHVQSDFVSIHAYLSMATLPDRLRPYMSVYLSSVFSLPITRSTGEKLTHEEVVNRLDNETVSYEADFGSGGGNFAESMRVTLKVETKMYEAAVAWLKDLIYGSTFNQERLQVTLAKIQQSLPEMKRDGDTVLSSVSSGLLYSDKSTSQANTIVPQIDHIRKLVEQLQASPDEVIRDFEEIRRHVTNPSGIRFSVAGNVLDLEHPRSALAEYFSKVLPATELAPVPFSADTLSEVGKTPQKKAIVVSLPTIESSFVMHTTKGIQGYDHPDWPAMRIAVEVLNATESYLWRYIRGSGLAYGAHVSPNLESGLLSFGLYRSSNSIEAFSQASTVIQNLVNGSEPFEDTTLDAAKSSVVYSIAKSVSTPGRAAVTSFINQALKGVHQNHNQLLLEKFQAVTKEDVLAIFRTYFLPLFDPTSSVAVVVTAPAKAEEIGQGLASAGFEVEQRTLEVDPDELSDSEGDSESGSESEESR